MPLHLTAPTSSVFFVVLACWCVYAEDQQRDTHSQCDRRCRDVFSAQQAPNITGTWMWPLDECDCRSTQGIIGRCSRSQPRVIPEWPLASVCGGDGVTYDSAAAACARGTFPLHGGFCGACSNAKDIGIYNLTRNNLTATTTVCALQLLLHGYDAGVACMNHRVGLSPPCTVCWVDNMACDADTCKADCLIAKLTKQPPVDKNGNLSSCLACDEDYCGDPFIRCAGANRRRSGIYSDIERSRGQVWNRTDC